MQSPNTPYRAAHHVAARLMLDSAVDALAVTTSLLPRTILARWLTAFKCSGTTRAIGCGACSRTAGAIKNCWVGRGKPRRVEDLHALSRLMRIAMWER